MFPPALPLIVYGIVFGLNAGQANIEFSIERFFMAGIVPGLVLLGILSIYCVFEGWRSKVPTSPIDLRGFFSAFWEAKWEVPIPFVILVSARARLAVLPEIAALTALYVFVVEVFVYKDIDIKRDLFGVTRESMTLVGAIMMKIMAATILTSFFVDAGVPDRLFQWLSQFVHSQWAFLLVLNVLLLLVGCLMDIFSAIVVVVPLIVPAAAQFHIDPYHLGVIFLSEPRDRLPAAAGGPEPVHRGLPLQPPDHRALPRRDPVHPPDGAGARRWSRTSPSWWWCRSLQGRRFRRRHSPQLHDIVRAGCER